MARVQGREVGEPILLYVQIHRRGGVHILAILNPYLIKKVTATTTPPSNIVVKKVIAITTHLSSHLSPLNNIPPLRTLTMLEGSLIGSIQELLMITSP